MATFIVETQKSVVKQILRSSRTFLAKIQDALSFPLDRWDPDALGMYASVLGIVASWEERQLSMETKWSTQVEVERVKLSGKLRKDRRAVHANAMQLSNLIVREQVNSLSSSVFLLKLIINYLRLFFSPLLI
jgi:hypothetical protein